MVDLLTTVEALGRAVPAWCLAITLWTGALWLAVRMLDALLQRRIGARWRLPLYAVVLLRVALPVDWQSPASPWPALTPELAQGPGLDAAPAVVSELAAPPRPVLIRDRAEVETVAATSTSTAAVPSSIPLGWGSLVLVVWLMGAGALLLRLHRHHRRLRTIARRGSAAPASLREQLPAGHRLRIHPFEGPLAFGILRPTVVLPRALLRADATTLRCVLAHERAHLAARDPLVVALLGLVTALAWPVLPVWLAARRVRALLELAADEHAVAGQGERWREYGRVMIDLAASTPPEPSPALSLHGHLRERVVALRHRRRFGRLLQGVVGLSVPLGVLACAGCPQGPEPRPDHFVERCEQLADRFEGLPQETVDEVERRAEALADLARAYENADEAEVMSKRCRDATRDALVSSATVWHDFAEQSDYRSTPEGERLRIAAASAYESFAALFPEDPDAYDLKYYHAELLWARASAAHNRGDDSAALFLASGQQFVELLERFPEGGYTEDAAYGQFLAAANALGKPIPAEEELEGLQRAPYGPAARALRHSCDRYFEHARRSSDTYRVAFTCGSLAMRHNHFDEARPWIEQALDGSLRTSDATSQVRAAEMLVDLHTIAWADESASAQARAAAGDEIQALFQRLREHDSLWSSPVAQRLREAAGPLESGVAWKEAMALYEAGDHVGCAEAYAALVAEYPEHREREDILRNAITCYEAAGNEARVAEMRALLPEG